MSSHSVKSSLSGFLRKVFGKGAEPEAAVQADVVPAPAPVAESGHSTASAPAATPVHKNGNGHTGKGIELPLQSILSGLPTELQPRLKHSYSGALTVCVPLEKILSQLSRGAVKITFGELRQAAPNVFTPENDRDRVSVNLPLAEILPRLNPALITRRREQKQVEIPAEISSPFDARGRGLVFSVGPAKAEAAAAPAARHAAPSPAPAAPVVPAAPIVPMPAATRNTITFTPTPPPPSAIPLSSPAMKPAARSLQELGIQMPAHSSLTPLAPIPMPAAAAPATDSIPLVIGLAALAEAWPEAVRKELAQAKPDAKAELPGDLVEKGLRQGKIAFPWKTLRAWIKPALPATSSAQDNSVLELPLKIVAPLFLAQKNDSANGKKKVIVDEEIPNLFFGFPQAETGSARVNLAKPAATKTQDTNYYAKEEAQILDATGQANPSPGTKFVAKYATPNEVVSRASSLDGVVGALIALPDGLMVASKLSPDLNGDTLAAFLPQIFGKVNQCTKELRMGELNNLNFTVGNVPWKIFRVNAIFFAAFGRAGEPLPTAQLAALAAELDHKPK